MKVKVPLMLLVLVALLGYVLGTEKGRSQRDVLLVKIGRKDADTPAVDAERAVA